MGDMKAAISLPLTPELYDLYVWDEDARLIQIRDADE